MNGKINQTCLLGDIGGTNIRLAWQEALQAPLSHVRVFPCSEFPSIEQAIDSYLKLEGLSMPRQCAIGIANPVTGDWVRMTNHSWSFSQEALKSHLGVQRLVVINDFTALALALPDLPSDSLIQIGGGQAVENSALGLIGPGTGLGISGLIYSHLNGQWSALSGEGGHITLAAQTEEEFAILSLIRRRYGHASAERILSGPGLLDLYLALRQYRGIGGNEVSGAAEITALALHEGDALALQTLHLFSGFLGSVAGDLALTLGARGGIYIGGGVVPRLLGWIEHSALRERFESKGRFRSYLQNVPLWVIHAPVSPALAGVSKALSLANACAK
jgi:glucokinase